MATSLAWGFTARRIPLGLPAVQPTKCARLSRDEHCNGENAAPVLGANDMYIIYIDDDPALGRYVAQGLTDAGHGNRDIGGGNAGPASVFADPADLSITD